MGKTALIGKENIETDFSSEIIEIELPGGTRGLKGDTGEKGDTGKTPQFHIGEVKDADDAEASITGTTDDPVLNLGLPKGKSGVWVGEDEPTDEQYNVWVDPEGTAGTIPTKVSQLENDSGYVTSTVNNLTNYELKTNTGATIDLSIDSSTYVMTLALKNSAGTTISTDSIDLPLETMVVGASYDSQTKEIVLTLKNGNTTRFSVADLVSGLVSSDYLTTNYYNKTTVDTNIANVVTDSSSQSTTTAYSANYVNNAVKDTYSTTETLTNKVWIDNKPIYRKVYTGNAVKSGKVILENDISFIDTLINTYGTANSQYDWNWTIPNFSSGYEVLVRMSDDTDDLQIYFGSNYTTSHTYKAVVEYTKTTD